MVKHLPEDKAKERGIIKKASLLILINELLGGVEDTTVYFMHYKTLHVKRRAA